MTEFQDFSTGESSISFTGKGILRDFLRPHGPIKEKLQDYDVILDSGAGDSFTDIYGLKRLLYISYAHNLAFAKRIPVILGPQTIGPFDTKIGQWIAKRSIRNVALFQTRDSASARYSVQLNRSPDILSTDVVFCLPTPKVDKSRDIILNVSGLLWQNNPHVDSVRYRAEVRRFIETACARDRKVTLLAHVLDNPSHDNDVPTVLSLAREFDGDVEVVVPRGLSEARQILGSATVAIGARMHACLNALSMGTPAVPWAYSRKFAPLLDDLGWARSVDLRSSVDFASETLREMEGLEDTGDAEVANLRMRAERKIRDSVSSLRQFDLTPRSS